MGRSAGAASEIIDHGRNGFLIDPGDLVTPRILIEKLYADGSLLHQISLAALAQFKQHPPGSGR
jgi:glycosyltransferase involved in cell wall biosynthesis